MKPRTTLILLVLALLIGAFVWYDKTHLQTTETTAEQSKRVFPNLKSSDITGLEIHNTNGVIAAEKSGDKWSLTQPYHVAASKSEVESILSNLEFLDAQRVMTPKDLKQAGVTLQSYGLDTPRAQATIIYQGKTNTIQVGDNARMGNALYASVSGRQNVYLVDRSLLDYFGRKVDELRDRTVVEFTPSQLKTLELRTGNRSIELTRMQNSEDATETWLITSPIKARADRDRIDDITGKLAALRIETFVTEDPKDLKPYGLDDPPEQVILTGKDPERPVSLLFGSAPTNDPAKVYVAVTSEKQKAVKSIFAIRNDIVTNLVWQVNDLRDRSLADSQPDRVDGVGLQVGGPIVQVSRHAGQWRIDKPAEMQADQEACSNLVENVLGAQIKEFVADVVTDPGQYGLDKPGIQVRLEREKVVLAAGTNEPAKIVGEPKPASTNAAIPKATASTTERVPFMTIQVGKPDPAKGIVYVKRADEPFVYGVETGFVAALPKSVLDLRDRTIVHTDASTIRKVAIARGSQQWEAERAATKGKKGVETLEWRLISPAHGVLAADAVDEAVSSLADLRADKLVADNPASLAPFGLDQPEITATFVSIVATNAPAQTRALAIGKTGPDQRHYAVMKGNPLVFELDAATYERLNRNFLTPQEPGPSPATPSAGNPQATPVPPPAAEATNHPSASGIPNAPNK